MRLFEVVLMLMNVLSLFLALRKPMRGVWLGLAGANLFVCLIHGLLEGFRYQLTFSYLFVLLFTLYAFVKIFTKFAQPKVVKGIVIVLSLLCLVFTAFLAYALPVFTLPKLTGKDEVGITYFHLVDEKRKEPFLAKATQKRELMVKVYYPAQKDDAKPVAPYFHGSSELLRLFTAGYGMPDFMFSHLNLVKTYAKENVQLSDRQQRYPVILFSHGGGTSMEVHTAQCEDLASHGYIVVAIDHTYVSGATAFPNRVVAAREATTDFKSPDPVDIITQIMVEDAQFVIDKLGEMNTGKVDSMFKEKLDMEKIGAIGQSLGGAVAYNLAINDSRVKAAINLDGSVYVTPKKDGTKMAPFLMLANDEYHIQAIEKREPLIKKFEDLPPEEQQLNIDIYGSKEAYDKGYKKAAQNIAGLAEVVKASGNLYTIEGSAHMKFADIGLFFGSSQVRDLIGIHGTIEPARCLEITEALTTVFFDQHLKGESKGSVESLLQHYPELKKR